MKPTSSALRPLLPGLAASAFLLFGLPAAQAGSVFWNLPSGGDLNAADSWNPSGIPTVADTAFFNLDSDYTVTTSSAINLGYMDVRGISGTVSFDFTNGTVSLGATGISPLLVNQNTSLIGGRLEGSAQVGTANSSKTFTITGAGTEMIGSGGFVGRTAGAAADLNKMVIQDGGSYSSTSSNALVIGAAESAFTANGNNLTVTGAGSSLNMTGGIILGNISIATTGAQASNNSFTVTDGASATIGSLLISRRTTGSLQTANNNTVSVGGGTGDSLLTVNGAISIGGIGQNATVTANAGGTIVAKTGDTTVVGRTGNALRVVGGTFDAAGRTITVGNAAGISLRDGGTLRAGTILLQSGGKFGHANDGNTAFSSGNLQVENLSGTFLEHNFYIGSNVGTLSAVYEMLGNGTHHFNKGVSVSTNGRLQGTGAIHTGDSVLSNLGTIGHASQVTSISLTGALTSGNDALYELFLQDGTTYSRIGGDNATSVDFNGTLRVTLADGFSAAAGTTFELFDFDQYNGTFSHIEFAPLASGLAWDTSNLHINGTVSVIPEGRTYGMIFTGAALLLAARYRGAFAAKE